MNAPRIRRSARNGFTLLELLVAISVLSIVSIIAWRGLDSLVMTRARLNPEVDDVRALLTAFGQLERDLNHVASPTLFALRANPVVVQATLDGQMLEIVRVAPAADEVATAIQQVYYRVVDGVLVRRATPPQRSLDPLDAETLSTARLLGSVREMRVRVWLQGLGWVTPGTQGMGPPQSPEQQMQPPQGIEVTVERTDGKSYRRVLLVG
jgi:general secretion pathway protein J